MKRPRRDEGRIAASLICLVASIAVLAGATTRVRGDDGFPGFGLSFHPGYGYGGRGLGVGPSGGDPFFGGPGYPHPAPALRRFGRITPFFAYDGGGSPNRYQASGPLIISRPYVVTNQPGGDFGAYTGARHD